MNPAFSVVFLTTLSGAAQGLLIALVGVESAAWLGVVAQPAAATAFYVSGAALAVLLGGLGLIASFFHLGHPERAWRAIAMWRTSWLSRECLCLPAFLACAFLYGVAHWLGSPWSLAIGWLGVLASAALFVCTAMIYACLRFLQEWATPLTLVNFVLLGCASGLTLATALSAWFAPALTVALAIGACVLTLAGCASGLTLATALSAWFAPALTEGLAICACVLTLAGCASRSASLLRNARLRPKSTVQSATGIRNPKLVQVSRGFTAGAFNLREFFHGKSARTLRGVKWGFLAGAFVVPIVLIALGAGLHSIGASFGLLAAACLVQYAGLVAERWFFFAEAKHPQNLYYAKLG